jgi:hypothetical protein
MLFGSGLYHRSLRNFCHRRKCDPTITPREGPAPFFLVDFLFPVMSTIIAVGYTITHRGMLRGDG